VALWGVIFKSYLLSNLHSVVLQNSHLAKSPFPSFYPNPAHFYPSLSVSSLLLHLLIKFIHPSFQIFLLLLKLSAQITSIFLNVEVGFIQKLP